ncbi:MAG: DUF3833 family protein [Pseudomonadota bacterium]
MPNDMSADFATQDVQTKNIAVGGPLDLTEFLQGQSSAWGIFEDRFGKLRRTFIVELDGAWQGHDFVLNESFVFDDGERMHRVWRITPTSDGKFKAHADDVIGEAEGWTDGDAVRLSYDFMLRMGKNELSVRFSDRFYRVDTHNLMNKATLSKWGVTLGEMTIFFQRANNDVGSTQTPIAA